MTIFVSEPGGSGPRLIPGVIPEAGSGCFGGESERYASRQPAGRNRVVPTMRVAAAGFAFLLYVADFTAGGDLAIAPDDATAAQCGEAEKANETHDTTLAAFSSKLCTVERAAI